MARALHERSGRTGSFVAVNCGALPRTLVENQLFGYEKDAFSGAIESSLGLIRAADGGTLFLDEIAELTEPSQVALLRVLQEGEVHPVGAIAPIRVDVRVVAATHRDLEARIADGSFREDLYARISGASFNLPMAGHAMYASCAPPSNTPSPSRTAIRFRSRISRRPSPSH